MKKPLQQNNFLQTSPQNLVENTNHSEEKYDIFATLEEHENLSAAKDSCDDLVQNLKMSQTNVVDNCQSPIVHEDLATTMVNKIRRSPRVVVQRCHSVINEVKIIKQKNNPGVNSIMHANNNSLVNNSTITQHVDTNSVVAEVLRQLKSENTEKSDIEIVKTYSKPDTAQLLSILTPEVVLVEDGGVDKMIKVSYDKSNNIGDEMQNLTKQNNKPIDVNLLRNDNIITSCSDKIVPRQRKNKLKTMAQVSLKINTNIHKTMIKTLESIQKRRQLKINRKYSNTSLTNSTTKQQNLRSVMNISSINNISDKINTKMNVKNNRHQDRQRNSKNYLTSKKFHMEKYGNLTFNVVKLRSGKILNSRKYHHLRNILRQTRSTKAIVTQNKRKKQRSKTTAEIKCENIETNNKNNAKCNNTTLNEDNKEKIFDLSGEIKLGQWGVKLNDECNTVPQLSESCSFRSVVITRNITNSKHLSKIKNEDANDNNAKDNLSSKLYELQMHKGNMINEVDAVKVCTEKENNSQNSDHGSEDCSCDEICMDDYKHSNFIESDHPSPRAKFRSNSLCEHDTDTPSCLVRTKSLHEDKININFDLFYELHNSFEKKINLYTLASQGNDICSYNLSLQNLAQEFDESDVVENILHRNNVIIVIRKLTICFYEHANSSTFFGSPKYWQLKGKLMRYIPIKEFRLLQVTNCIFYCSATCTLAYVELFGKQRPVHAKRSTMLCSVSAAFYCFKLNELPERTLVHLDYAQCLYDGVIFTVIPWERALMLGYMMNMEFKVKKYVINEHYSSIQNSYTLPTMRFHCQNLQAIDDDIIIGFGEGGQIVLWNHLTKTILYAVNKTFIKDTCQPPRLIDDLGLNPICVWSRLDSFMDTLHLLLYCERTNCLQLILVNKKLKQYKSLHKYYMPDKYRELLDVTIGQYKLAVNFREGAQAYDFPLDMETDSSSIINLKMFPPLTLFPNDRYVIHLKNNVAFSMTVDRL